MDTHHKTHLWQLRERISGALPRPIVVKDLATVLGITPAYLGQLERGSRPGSKFARAFATLFGIGTPEAWALTSHEMSDEQFETLAPRLVARGVELIGATQSGGIADASSKRGDGRAVGIGAGDDAARPSAACVAGAAAGDRAACA